MRGLKVMSSNDKQTSILKEIQTSFLVVGLVCFSVIFVIVLYCIHFKYCYNTNIKEFILLSIAIYIGIIILIKIGGYKYKLYFLFQIIWIIMFIITMILSLILTHIFENIIIIYYFSFISGFSILVVNAAVNRSFFSSGKLEKTEIKEKSASDLANSNSSDEGEKHKQAAPLKHQDDNEQKSFSYIKKEQTVDEISNEFGIDVLSISLFLGIIFGSFAYLFFVPNQATPSFFGSIDVKTVAIATAGLVTFFWAAKTAKNKSIELEEKKQDGKRGDKEIKMAEARDTVQLIATASELLGSESDAQKYAGLAFLNRVASQKGGPLQKEAIDLLADFILSASDITTSNKPRMRAITYVDKLLDDILPDYQIKAFIEISSEDATDYFNHMLNLDNYVFKKLTVVYIGFAVYFRFIDKVNELKIDKRIVLSDCKVFGKRRNGNILDLTGIALLNSTVYCCKIKEIPTSDSIDFYDKEAAEWNSKDDINKFVFCDFSDCVNWEDALSVVIANKNDIFDGCFYYAGHAPDGFDEEGEGALLTKITSEQQFDELLGDDPICMKYSPPDDDKKTSNE